MTITARRPESGQDAAAVVRDLRMVHNSGHTRNLQWRLVQLENITRLVDNEEAAIAEALEADLGRNAVECWLGEIASTKGEAEYARKNLRRWMRRKRTGLPLTLRPGNAWIQYEPLGVVLIVGPWNYPVYLTLGPLVAAVAAGNCAVIKPSEHAPRTSALLAELIPTYLDSSAVRVVEGDASVTQELLGTGVDHVLFTGGTEVGRHIMAGAAPTLTPVTLELGGKSPALVASDADLGVVARRLLWVKLMNSGQTCIAPDYVLVQREVRDALVEKLKAVTQEFRVGQRPAMRIVNDRQFRRLAGYLEATEGEIVLGGGIDESALSIEPTIVVEPSLDEPLMQEEIFGPILPIIGVDSLEDDAVHLVNSRSKPLAVYVFTKSNRRARALIDRMPAGGAVINHVAMHCMVPNLPFGGVGASGMGAYHGRWGFEAMSHRKSVLSQSLWPDLKFMYPPYSDRALKLFRRMF
ncbi:aldehyde dehydrogenase family protein [Rhodococcus sp. USK13]|uniref:aldehyde dehydrogenase family protein n=1 Tax=Rhodococcus sp. USK13 TaxID=2806442 RepID=UPI001BCED50A|nr:aldehyde dehydrogenase family protein [Rhodococcus sp. USK13]